ncbi:MAG TPA: hypothetical protein PKW21_06560 [Rhabdaerophilum sp.]|nr:hypothetical protein [Rhabdaerophilum sp.]
MKGNLILFPPQEVGMSTTLRLDFLALAASFALLVAIVFGLF